jgi:hypothetical protein
MGVKKYRKDEATWSAEVEALKRHIERIKDNERSDAEAIKKKHDGHAEEHIERNRKRYEEARKPYEEQLAYAKEQASKEKDKGSGKSDKGGWL